MGLFFNKGPKEVRAVDDIIASLNEGIVAINNSGLPLKRRGEISRNMALSKQELMKLKNILERKGKYDVKRINRVIQDLMMDPQEDQYFREELASLDRKNQTKIRGAIDRLRVHANNLRVALASYVYNTSEEKF